MGQMVSVVILWILSGVAMAGDNRAATCLEGSGRLLGERLSVMKDVAVWKRDAGRAVEDKKREAVILTRIRRTAGEKGLPPEAMVRLFEEQIRLAKKIQRYWLRRWSEGPGPKKGPDLTSIRTRLDRMGEQILAHLQGCRGVLAGGDPPKGSQAKFTSLLQPGPALSNGDTRLLFQRVAAIMR